MDDIEEEFDHKRRTYGYLLTYVDDFLIVAPSRVRKAIEEEISRFWKVRIEGQVKQYDKQNPEASLTFLSTVIRSHSTWRLHDESGSIYKGRIEDLGDDEL